MSDGHLNKCAVCVTAYVKAKQQVSKICLMCDISFVASSKKVKTCSSLCHSALVSKTKNELYEGTKLSYGGVHRWVKRNAGKACSCDLCGIADDNALYDWSNISGEYKRDLSDWQRLCRKCHVIYDNTHNGRLDKRKGISDNRDRDALGRYI